MELSSPNIKKFLIFSYISGNRNPVKFFIFREIETLKSFLYFGKWNFLAQARKMKKMHPPPQKKILIFQEIEFSDSKIKKFLILSQKKAFLIFPEMEIM